MVKRRTVYAKIEGSSPFSFGGPTVSETCFYYIYVTNYIKGFLCRARKEREGAREAKDRIKLSSMDLQSTALLIMLHGLYLGSYQESS